MNTGNKLVIIIIIIIIIIMTPFSMTSSCLLGSRQVVLVYCTLANCKVFLRQITAGGKHNGARFDKTREILTVEDLTPKERRLELQ